MKKNGFTLLEMLIVISIIAILVGMGTVSYSTAQKKARDAKRKADLHAMQNALEQCYAVGDSEYPTISKSNGDLTISVDCTADGGPSMSITDPTTKTYAVTADASSYSISIDLEDGSTASISNLQ